MSSTYVAWTRKLGNIEETLLLNVSRIVPRLLTHGIFVEDVKFASFFASFAFAHPSSIESNIDTKCLCSNIFSFTPALRRKALKCNGL